MVLVFTCTLQNNKIQTLNHSNASFLLITIPITRYTYTVKSEPLRKQKRPQSTQTCLDEKSS